MTEISALPILAYKIGPNLFDISRDLHHVSMRDQAHRAIALAEGLVTAKQVNPGTEEVLIVGAGVAGATAAIVLARHGIRTCVVDADTKPFAKQFANAMRRVGPYMYEWPLAVFDDQRLPSEPPRALSAWVGGSVPPLDFAFREPVSPGLLAVRWTLRFRQELSAHRARLRVRMGVDPHHALEQITAWVVAQRAIDPTKSGAKYAPHDIRFQGGGAWKTSAPTDTPIQPRFIILAGGMGDENISLNASSGGEQEFGQRFWANDRLLDKQCGHLKKPRLVILGGGDGALQDTLRVMTGHVDPLKTWENLLKQARSTTLPNAMRQCAVLERQQADTLIWATTAARGHEMTSVLDAAYQKIALDAARNTKVVASVLGILREDVESLHLCVRENSFGKAYGLNRFLVRLFFECISRGATMGMNGAASAASRFVLRHDTEVKHVKGNSAPYEIALKDGGVLFADEIVVRFGPRRDNLSQSIGLNSDDTQDRTLYAAMPLPLYMPPTA